MDDRVQIAESTSRGRGCFSKAGIPVGTIVFAMGGRAMMLEEEDCDYGIQIADNFSLGPKAGEESGADMVNHSCEPNLGFVGQVFLVTLRDVVPGEELCFDYAMCLGGIKPYRFSCKCGTASCRKTVTHQDWTIPELQSRYAGHFQWYLQACIQRAVEKRSR